MRRRRWLALVAGAGALLLTPVMAGAAPLTSAQVYEPIGYFRFCAEAQIPVANMDEALMAERNISVGGKIYESYADFTASKSAVDIEDLQVDTVTYVDFQDAERTQPKMIRCKLRTGESFAEGAWPEGNDENNPGIFAVDPYYGFGELGEGISTDPVDQQCTVANQATIDAVWQSLTPEQRDASPYTPEGVDPTLITAPDSVAGSGPEWLNIGSTPALRVVGDDLVLQSRALLVPTETAGARIAGAHYCTLAPPVYLRDVLLGDRAVL